MLPLLERAADRMAPRYDVLTGTQWNAKKKKRAPVHIPDFKDRWGPSQRLAFEDIRHALFPKHPFHTHRGARKRLITDASQKGYGAVLLQYEGPPTPTGPTGTDKAQENMHKADLDPDSSARLGEWRPITFLARALKGAEPRWTTSELECGAVVFAIQKLWTAKTSK